jgi:hypothetical protein
MNKYITDKRKYCVRFLFTNKEEAMSFKLPDEYKIEFDLVSNIDKDRGNFIRIAQIKPNQI